MAETTGIEWADATWSPVWGCTQVSPACDNCYAKALGHRFGTEWGPDAPRREFGEAHWRLPLRWNRKAAVNREQWKVFPSMCDPFDKDWPEGVRERFWELIEATPNLTWLLLTKRIGNAKWMLPARWVGGFKPMPPLGVSISYMNEWGPVWADGVERKWVDGKFPANVWLGATVINQEEANRDIPKLLATTARVRFLSIEPMLGPIDLTEIGADRDGWGYTANALTGELDGPRVFSERASLARIDWVIAGGESGPKARPVHPDWFRSLRDQCAAASVPFMFKQWGEWLPATEGRSITGQTLVLTGHAPFSDNPPWHRFADGQAVARVGKKAAGRVLDDVTHDGFPA